MTQQTNPAQYSIDDAKVHVCFDQVDDAVLAMHGKLKRFLRAHGFRMLVDQEHRRKYPSLRNCYYGQRDQLEARLDCFGRVVELEFFQNVNFENPHGGRYDFHRVAKMPWLILLRWRWIKLRLRAFFAAEGIGCCERRNPLPNPDPLLWFNESWDSDYDRKRGTHRFERGADGWPTDRELKCWRRTDGDGVILEQGSTRYILRGGRWVRCRVYGGINGMWTCVYGPGRSDFSQEHGGAIRSTFPGRGRRCDARKCELSIKQALRQAISQRQFLRAQTISEACERQGINLAGVNAEVA